MKERIQPRPKPLGDKDLTEFSPLLPPINPLKERSKREVEVGLKRSKKKRVAAEGGKDAPGWKKMRVGNEDTPIVEKIKEGGVEVTPEGVVALEAQAYEGQGAQVEKEHMSAMGPETQVESGSAGPEQGMEQPAKGGPVPQGERERARLKTVIYHTAAVSGRLEGEGTEARTAAGRLLGVVEDVAVCSMASFMEAELLRGLCSAQMEVTALAGALLNKAARAKGEVQPLKAKLEEVKTKLESLRREIGGWRKVTQSACVRGLEYTQNAKKTEVLAMVQGYSADRANAELLATKLELETERRKVVSLEFQLAGEQKKLEEAQKACTAANERWDDAMVCNEDLRAQLIKEKEEADLKIAELERVLADERAKSAAEKAGLEKTLEEERAKLASERAAYPDQCVAAVEQFKGSADFQMAIDAAIASSLAREGERGAGSSGATAGSRSEEEVIQSFQRSDFYKHEMTEFWDNGWKTFKHKAEELFPDLDFNNVRIDKGDVAQTPLDEGVDEEDLASSEDE
ncbi:hypothetical protein CsSME_00035367 [Camellia sinensis var. sinensis]